MISTYQSPRDNAVCSKCIVRGHASYLGSFRTNVSKSSLKNLATMDFTKVSRYGREERQSLKPCRDPRRKAIFETMQRSQRRALGLYSLWSCNTRYKEQDQLDAIVRPVKSNNMLVKDLKQRNLLVLTLNKRQIKQTHHMYLL